MKLTIPEITERLRNQSPLLGKDARMYIADGFSQLSEEQVLDGGVTSSKIADGAVGSMQLADGSVTTPKLANEAVTTEKIARRNVTSDRIAPRAVTPTELFTSPLGNRVLAVEGPNGDPNYVQITNRMIEDGAIGSPQLADASVTYDKIPSDAIRVRHILNNNVTTPKINNRAVTGEKLFSTPTPNRVLAVRGINADAEYVQVEGAMIRDNTIEGHHIREGSIITDTLANGSITSDKLADDSVETRHLVDEAVTTEKIADGAVDHEKIRLNSVRTQHILDGNVTVDKIADLNVTTEKIADGAVTTEKIGDESVTTEKIADLNVTTDKIADEAVTTEKVADSNITTNKIADRHITSEKIANRGVTGNELFTSAVDNRVLAALNSGEDPIYVQINEAMIADDAIKTIHLEDGSITTDKLADDAVRTRHVMDRNITTEKVNHRAITGGELFTSPVAHRVLAVKGSNADPTYVQINNEMIAEHAVRERHILDRNVTTPKIAPDAVRTHHIMDRNVTSEKINHRAVTGSELFTTATPHRVLAVEGVNADAAFVQVSHNMLADDAVRSRHIKDSNVTTEKIANEAVTSEKIAPRHVTGSELFTSAVENVVLRVDNPGEDPYYGKVNMATDFEGTLPVVQGGTGANNPDEARNNLEAASDAAFQAHIGNQNIHVSEKDRRYWEGETFGPFNAHEETIDITFAAGKRFRLTGSGTCTAHDATGARITSLVRYHPWGQGSGNATPISFSSGSVTIHSTIGFTAGRVGYADIILHFHGDDTWYNVQVFSRANNSNTGGEAGSSSRLQQVRILVKEMI